MIRKFPITRKSVVTSAAVALAAVAIFLFLHRTPGVPKVPLGVEQAAIVTFSGSELQVAPYKWGVAVNVRIAGVSKSPERCVYDVRYFVNRPGVFDLKDYLVAADGSSLEGLPSFRFEGDAKRSTNLENRIRETEELRIAVGGHYDQILVVLFLLWIGWLLLLIFYRRPYAAQESGYESAAPSLADVLRGIRHQLEAGSLDAAGKARMEMLLLHGWRKELALGPVSMKAVMRAIGRDARTGAQLRQLEHWLHHPASPVSRSEIAAMLEALAAAAQASEPIPEP